MNEQSGDYFDPSPQWWIVTLSLSLLRSLRSINGLLVSSRVLR